MNSLYIEETMPVATATADINGAGVDTNWISLTKAESVVFQIALGAITAGASAAVTFQYATDYNGTGAATQTFPSQYTTNLSSGSSAATLTTGATSLTIGGSDDNKLYTFEIKAADVTAGATHVRMRIADPGQSCLCTTIAQQRNSTYPGSQTNSLAPNPRGSAS